MTYSLTGWPVAVVYAGTSPEGLPIGVQIAARTWREDVALAVTQQIETALAALAEAAGWDGFFLWDDVTINIPIPVADPWIALSAIALRTRALRLGALVTPLPRRRPWKVARETVTLDHLSQGRLIVGVGLGGDPAEFDEPFVKRPI